MVRRSDFARDDSFVGFGFVRELISVSRCSLLARWIIVPAADI